MAAGTAWALAQQLAAVSRAARCGVPFHAGLEADRDDIVQQPDPDVEGGGSTLQDGVGTVERRDNTATTQPDKGGAQQLIWQLGRQLGTGIVPWQRKSRSIQIFFLKFLTIESTETHLLAKIHWAGQLECQKLPQPGKDQCLRSAVHGGRGVHKVTPRPKSPHARSASLRWQCSLSTTLFNSG